MKKPAPQTDWEKMSLEIDNIKRIIIEGFTPVMNELKRLGLEFMEILNRHSDNMDE